MVGYYVSIHSVILSDTKTDTDPQWQQGHGDKEIKMKTQKIRKSCTQLKEEALPVIVDRILLLGYGRSF